MFICNHISSDHSLCNFFALIGKDRCSTHSSKSYTPKIVPKKKRERIACTWVFVKGSKVGQQCTTVPRNSKNKHCNRHSKKDKTPVVKRDTCIWIFTKGSKKGQRCTVTPRNTDHSVCCSKHTFIKKDTCTWTFTKGTKKGMRCLVIPRLRVNSCCSKHNILSTKERKTIIDRDSITDGVHCRWISKSSGVQCTREVTDKIPFCTTHIKTKRFRHMGCLGYGRDICKWLIVTNKKERTYRTSPKTCTNNVIDGIDYCVRHLYCKQAWIETIKDVPPRCTHIYMRVKHNSLCGVTVVPGYKKCKKHSK